MVLTKKEYDEVFGDAFTHQKDPNDIIEFKGITISLNGLHKQDTEY